MVVWVWVWVLVVNDDNGKAIVVTCDVDVVLPESARPRTSIAALFDTTAIFNY